MGNVRGKEENVSLCEDIRQRGEKLQTDRIETGHDGIVRPTRVRVPFLLLHIRHRLMQRRQRGRTLHLERWQAHPSWCHFQRVRIRDGHAYAQACNHAHICACQNLHAHVTVTKRAQNGPKWVLKRVQNGPIIGSKMGWFLPYMRLMRMASPSLDQEIRMDVQREIFLEFTAGWADTSDGSTNTPRTETVFMWTKYGYWPKEILGSYQG